MNGELANCPGCGSDQHGAPIPEEDRQYYSSGATHYWRTLMVEIPGVYDGGLYYQCPDCGRRWHRWPETHHLHVKAAPYVAGGFQARS